MRNAVIKNASRVPPDYFSAVIAFAYWRSSLLFLLGISTSRPTFSDFPFLESYEVSWFRPGWSFLGNVFNEGKGGEGGQGAGDGHGQWQWIFLPTIAVGMRGVPALRLHSGLARLWRRVT